MKTKTVTISQYHYFYYKGSKLNDTFNLAWFHSEKCEEHRIKVRNNFEFFKSCSLLAGAAISSYYGFSVLSGKIEPDMLNKCGDLVWDKLKLLNQFLNTHKNLDFEQVLALVNSMV